MHAKILDATESIDAGATASDPITGQPVVRKPDTPLALKREHFGAKELAGIGTLVPRLLCRLGLWLGAFLAIVIGMAATSGDAQEYVVSIGAICCSALFVLVPWDLVRLRVASSLPAANKVADAS